MNAKKAKLDAQFNHSKDSESSSSKEFGIFHGVSVWINGFTGWYLHLFYLDTDLQICISFQDFK